MAEEVTVRDIFLQMETRLGRVEDQVRGLRDEMAGTHSELRAEMTARFGELRAEMIGQSDQVDSRFGEVRAEFAQLRSEMNGRFGRANALQVTVLLAVVIGLWGMWMK